MAKIFLTFSIEQNVFYNKRKHFIEIFKKTFFFTVIDALCWLDIILCFTILVAQFGLCAKYNINNILLVNTVYTVYYEIESFIG